MADVEQLTSDLKARARELGFDLVAVARAEPPPHAAALDPWLAAGHAGEMAYLARNAAKRQEPGLVVPGARSIVVAGVHYRGPEPDPAMWNDPARGQVSRYAWGDDYHDVVGDKLRSLLRWVKEQWPEAEGKPCVDAEPTMDKAWALRAGLGWIGKHSNLITREYGSWVFLGELLLNLELEYDTQPVEDHCGSCTLCLDACPTEAITEPRVVDSSRCISYATIELRSDTLPDDITAHQQGWLYGCDVCQDICPWKRFEKPTSEARFEPRLGETSLELTKVLELTHAAYVERFRRSPIKRAKLSGLQRNARALLRDAQEENPAEHALADHLKWKGR